MGRIRRLLLNAAPFAALVAVFACALGWHLGAPARQAARFHRLVEDDAPLAHDYGDAAVVTLEREGCPGGQCPAYRVRIHGSGEVEFHGRAFVCVMTPLTDRVLRPTAQRLIDAMVRSGFDALPERGMGGDPRAAWAVTQLRTDAGQHRVDDRGPDDEAPVVAEIGRQIDRAAGTARWKRIPRNDGSQTPFCASPDGSKRVFDPAGRLVPEPRTPPPASAASSAGGIAR